MPIYEYRCRACNDEFEAIQKISDGQLRKCKKCGGRLEKLLSKTSFVLKGGGWYSDGYSAGSKKGASEGAKSDSSSKGDKKPAKKESPSKGSKKESS